MDRFKQYPFLASHYPLIFLYDQLFCIFILELRVVVFLLIELLLDISDNKILAEPRMEQIFFSFWVH